MRMSPKLSKIDVWLLRNSNRKPVFPIQNLPLDSRLEVRFHHFGCFCFGTWTIQKWAGWAGECSEWISGNSSQSAPEWTPWQASYRHVHNGRYLVTVCVNLCCNATQCMALHKHSVRKYTWFYLLWNAAILHNEWWRVTAAVIRSVQV